MQQNKKVIFQDLGLIDFKTAWDHQEKLFNEIIQIKIQNRNDPGNEIATPNYFLFCEHPHVYTLGKSGDEKNLLISEQALKDKNASLYKINRGGDITYHGPGQIIGYPIFDLENFFTDIHKYMRFLEEAIIQTLKIYGIESGRISGKTGVWLDPDQPAKARKICAMGVRCSRWVTMHGFAFNVDCDIDYFNNIVPCGIEGSAVTSIYKETGSIPDKDILKGQILKHFTELFQII